jgi:glycosyltransferase involved in cell wall biosynthesis
MGSLRPLWLTETYPPARGGMAQSCDRIVRHLRQAGAVIDVAHLDRRHADFTVELRAHGADLLGPVDEDPAHALERLWALVERRHAQAPYTHVVAFGGQIPLVGAPVWAAWLGLPLVTLLRGNDFDLGIFTPRRADTVRAALAASACVCTVTRDQARRVRALVPETPVVFTPNGIDHADWTILPADEQRGRQWRQAHVAAGQRVLGLFGQLKQKKGARFFLEALAASGVADRFHLLIVGDVEPALADWLREHQATVAASLLPFRDRFELLPLFAAADLVAIPSFYDGMPNVLLEAAVLGRPLLASDAGGMRDVLDTESALLFAAGDAGACRRTLALAADLPDAKLALMAERARARARAEFDVNHETARYLRVLSELGKPGATTGKPEEIESA